MAAIELRVIMCRITSIAGNRRAIRSAESRDCQRPDPSPTVCIPVPRAGRAFVRARQAAASPGRQPATFRLAG
jgi:hypothetical protein